jgi:hypothetical protein
MRKSGYAMFAASLIAGCAGHTPQGTEVVLKTGTAVVARAYVSKSVGGSDIVVAVEPPYDIGIYHLVLGEGTCFNPVTTHPLTVFNARDGARAHVTVPASRLTGGGYFLIVQRFDPGLISCTAISNRRKPLPP